MKKSKTLDGVSRLSEVRQHDALSVLVAFQLGVASLWLPHLGSAQNQPCQGNGVVNPTSVPEFITKLSRYLSSLVARACAEVNSTNTTDCLGKDQSEWLPSMTVTNADTEHEFDSGSSFLTKEFCY